MAATAEARSLSSLNILAANPPQYPVNPTESPRNSLVLYISRVPGTRDIILSTFKPQVKNVSAVDVTNSLYYVHLDLPSDELLVVPSPVRDEFDRRSSGESPRSPIARKPLPPTARVAGLTDETPNLRPVSASQPQGPALSFPPPSLLCPPTPTTGPKPAGPILNDPQPSSQPPARYPPPNVSSMSRTPLGPRSMGAPSLPERPRLETPAFPQRGRPVTPPSPYLVADPYAPHSHRLPPLPSPGSAAHGRPQAYPSSCSRSPSPNKPLPSRPFSTHFSLTLIRRDPTSGNQWNVGKISSFQTAAPPPSASDPDLAPHAAQPVIDIHIENSGYAKFRDMPTLRGPRPGSSSSAGPPAGGFSRQLTMSYGKSWASGLAHAFRRRERPNSVDMTTAAAAAAPPAGRGHTRHGSAASAADLSAEDGGPQGPSGQRARGYVFTSPWDGRCEFLTGNAGRSLRCRHVLREQDIGAEARAVSELRFNLPSSDIFRSRAEVGQQLPEHLSKFLKLEPGSDGEGEDDGPMDLSLGRERAGGGNRGKRAKLGKLIVHDEGLKMLDLVVAANVGVWWVAWERAF